MAAIFCDSFDHYGTANVLQKWNYGGCDIVNTVSRTGPQSCFFNGAGALFLTIDDCLNKTMIMGTAVRSSGFGEIIGLTSTIAVPFNLTYVNIGIGGILQVVVANLPGGAVVYSAPASTALHANVWYSIQFKILCKETNTGTLEVKLNGVTVINVTNVITIAPGVAAINFFVIGGPGGGSETYHDDVWLCDSTGGVNNDFLGDVIVVEQTPNADGHYTQWTPASGPDHFAMVDSIPPDTSKYVSDNTVGQKDTYVFPAPSIVLPATVLFRQALHFAETDIAGTRTMAPLFRQGGADALSAVSVSPSLNAYVFERQPFDLNPVTGLAWTTADLAACELGQQITA